METKSFGDQAKTNHQQEAQAQNNDSWMTVDKARQRLARQHHQADGNNHRSHHHGQVIDHPNSGNDGIEREYGVQHHDLRDHTPELSAFTLGGIVAVFSFQPFVELHSGFKQQEETAEQHDQIAGAEAEIANAEQRRGQCYQPGY